MLYVAKPEFEVVQSVLRSTVQVSVRQRILGSTFVQFHLASQTLDPLVVAIPTSMSPQIRLPVALSPIESSRQGLNTLISREKYYHRN
jgi:hypothetical protein